jgi:hypothetical protein
MPLVSPLNIIAACSAAVFGAGIWWAGYRMGAEAARAGVIACPPAIISQSIPQRLPAGPDAPVQGGKRF